ncbi:MAG: hypothetical protein ACOC22_00105 [bacterium]
MKTVIKTVHEEEYGDGTRIIGILYNYSIDDEFSDSFPYIYHKETYVFFKTIIDLFDYLLYGTKNTDVQRSYLTEAEFDEIYDSQINGSFAEIIELD